MLPGHMLPLPSTAEVQIQDPHAAAPGHTRCLHASTAPHVQGCKHQQYHQSANAIHLPSGVEAALINIHCITTHTCNSLHAASARFQCAQQSALPPASYVIPISAGGKPDSKQLQPVHPLRPHPLTFCQQSHQPYCKQSRCAVSWPTRSWIDV